MHCTRLANPLNGPGEAGRPGTHPAKCRFCRRSCNFRSFGISQPGDSACAPLDRNGGQRALYLLRRNILTPLRTLTESASDLGKEAKESVEQFGRSAGKKLDEVREETGAALHTAASSVRKTGRQGSDAISNLAAGAADRLDATASYVEDRDLRDAFAGLRRFGRRHLTGSLVAAAAVGFLAGSALSRAAHSCERKQ